MLLEFLAAHEVSGLAARLVKKFFRPACGRSCENVRNAELVTQNPDPFRAEGMEQERTKTAKRFIDPKYDSTLKTSRFRTGQFSTGQFGGATVSGMATTG